MGETGLRHRGHRLVGRAIVSGWSPAGTASSALARSEGAAAELGHSGAEPVHGDLLDERTLAAGCAATDVAYNVAGVNPLSPTDTSPLYRVNATARGTIVHAAAEAGVRRLVHTSSAATLGEAAGTEGREDSPHRGSFLSDYERSKIEASGQS